MRGGRRENSGRKLKWYGETVAMRIPAAWQAVIQAAMDKPGSVPVFKPTHLNIEKVTYS